jgi:DNA helicase II / ATP-dependent DNA helicase PcrA
LRGLLEINKDIVLIPAHVWTPWFAIFGSKSGFDSVEECFGDLSDKIFALETGLSSDPPMNRRMSELDKYSLVSFSDAHSADNLGREACVFDLEKVSYSEIIKAIRDKDPKRFLYTIEMDPGEGMYMADGHRLCGFCSNPKETKQLKGICPKCKKPLVIGVASQIDDRADRESGDFPKKAVPYKYIIPLREIISDALGVGKHSKSVDIWYDKLIKIAGSEFGLLLDFDLDKVGSGIPLIITEGIKRMRGGNVKVTPGFDGQYGVVKIFTEEEKVGKQQRKLF